MDFTSLLFIFINVTLFIGTESFWYMRKLYKLTAIFAVLQFASAYVAMEYFHLTLQQLLLVTLGYYAIAVCSTFYRMRARIRHALLVKA